ncbi:hypothetical protein Tco_1299364 [Tanacetum coccineum]
MDLNGNDRELIVNQVSVGRFDSEVTEMELFDYLEGNVGGGGEDDFKNDNEAGLERDAHLSSSNPISKSHLKPVLIPIGDLIRALHWG